MARHHAWILLVLQLIAILSHGTTAQDVNLEFEEDWEQSLYDKLAPGFDFRDFLETVNHTYRLGCFPYLVNLPASTWTRVDATIINQNNIGSHFGVDNYTKCINLCSANPDCLSVEFSYGKSQCILNNATLTDDNSRGNNDLYTYYEKPACPDEEKNRGDRSYAALALGLKALLSGWRELAAHEFGRAISLDAQLGIAYWGAALSQVPFFDFQLSTTTDPILAFLHGSARNYITMTQQQMATGAPALSEVERVAYVNPVATLLAKDSFLSAMPDYTTELKGLKGTYPEDRYLAAFAIQAAIDSRQWVEVNDGVAQFRTKFGGDNFQMFHYYFRSAFLQGNQIPPAEYGTLAEKALSLNPENPSTEFFAALGYYYFNHNLSRSAEVLGGLAEKLEDLRLKTAPTDLAEYLQLSTVEYLAYFLFELGAWDELGELMGIFRAAVDEFDTPQLKYYWYTTQASLYFGQWLLPHETRELIRNSYYANSSFSIATVAPLSTPDEFDVYGVEPEAYLLMASAAQNMSTGDPRAQAKYAEAISRLSELETLVRPLPSTSLAIRVMNTLTFVRSFLNGYSKLTLSGDDSASFAALNELIDSTRNEFIPRLHFLNLHAVRGSLILSAARGRNVVLGLGLSDAQMSFGTARDQRPLALDSLIGMIQTLVYTNRVTSADELPQEIEELVKILGFRYDGRELIRQLLEVSNEDPQSSPTVATLPRKLDSASEQLYVLLNPDSLNPESRFKNDLYVGARSPCVYLYDNLEPEGIAAAWDETTGMYLKTSTPPLASIRTPTVDICRVQCAYRTECRSFSFGAATCWLSKDIPTGSQDQEPSLLPATGYTYYEAKGRGECDPEDGTENAFSYFHLGFLALQGAMHPYAAQAFERARILDRRFSAAYLGEFLSKYLNPWTVGDARQVAEMALGRQEILIVPDDSAFIVEIAKQYLDTGNLDIVALSEKYQSTLTLAMKAAYLMSEAMPADGSDYSGLSEDYPLLLDLFMAHSRNNVAQAPQAIDDLNAINYTGAPALDLMELILTVRLGRWDDASNMAEAFRPPYHVPQLDLKRRELTHYVALQRGFYAQVNDQLASFDGMNLDPIYKSAALRMSTSLYFEVLRFESSPTSYVPAVTPDADLISQAAAITVQSFAAASAAEKLIYIAQLKTIAENPILTPWERSVVESYHKMAVADNGGSLRDAEDAAEALSAAFDDDSYCLIVDPTVLAFEYYTGRVLSTDPLPDQTVLDKAHDYIDRVLAKYPGRSSALYLRGLHEELVGNREGANTNYNILLQINWPNSPVDFKVRRYIRGYVQGAPAPEVTTLAVTAPNESDWVIYFIVAAAIVGALIILVVLVACAMWKKRVIKKEEASHYSGSVYSERVLPEPGSVSYKDETMHGQEEIGF